MKFKNGTAETTQIGYINKHNQMCRGHRGKVGTDHNALAYKMYCRDCRTEYGANGADVHLRKCPNCMGGAEGIEY